MAKVIHIKENLLEFDNGYKLSGYHEMGCCEYNYIDFEGIPVGTNIPFKGVEGIRKAITPKEDGFILKGEKGMKHWAQARSVQNGYYSFSIGLYIITPNGQRIPYKIDQWGDFEESFMGVDTDYV